MGPTAWTRTFDGDASSTFVINGDASSYRGALADALTFEDAKCTFVTNGYASSYRGALAGALADQPGLCNACRFQPGRRAAGRPRRPAEQPEQPGPRRVFANRVGSRVRFVLRSHRLHLSRPRSSS